MTLYAGKILENVFSYSLDIARAMRRECMTLARDAHPAETTIYVQLARQWSARVRRLKVRP